MVPERFHQRATLDSWPAGALIRADDTTSGAPVLLGVIQQPIAAAPFVLERLGRAADGRALLPVVWSGQANGTLTLATSVLADVRLPLLEQRGALAEATVLAAFRPLLELIERLHDQQPALLIGDLRPGDIVEHGDGEWALLAAPFLRTIDSERSPYRAPELAQPNAEPTRPSDTYALCALLYHALTGVSPDLDARTAPRSANPALSTLVEQVLLRGLQQRPDYRYQQVRELRLALATVEMLAGREVATAALPGAIDPAAPQIDVSPPDPIVPDAAPPRRGLSTGCLGTLAALLVLALAGICVGGLYVLPNGPFAGWGRSVNTAVSTTVPAISPPGGTTTATTTLPTSVPAAAGVALESAEVLTATSVLTSAEAGAVAFSDDGTLLAIGTGTGLTIRPTALDGDGVTLAGHDTELFAVRFSPDGTLLASGAINDPVIKIWKVSDGTLVRQLRGHTGWIRSLAFSPDGALLASGGTDGLVKLWNVADGAFVRDLPGHTDWVGGVAFSPDGAQVIASGRDGTLLRWAVTGGIAVTLFQTENDSAGNPYWATGVDYAPDGSQIALGATDSVVRLLAAEDGALIRELRGHDGWLIIHAFGYGPDGSRLYTGSPDGTVIVWNPANGTKIATIENRGLPISAIAAPTKDLLAVSSTEEGEVVLYDTATNEAVNRLRIGRGLILNVGYSPEGGTLVAGCINGASLLYRAAADETRLLLGTAPVPQPLAIVQDGRRLVISDQGSVVLVGDAPGDRTSIAGYDGSPLGIVASGDGRVFVVGTTTGAISVWQAPYTTEARRIQTALPQVSLLALSDDGRLLAASSRQAQRVDIWDTMTGELVRTINSEVAVNTLALNRQGTRLALLDVDGGLQLLDATTGDAVRIAAGTAPALTAAFSADGNVLAVAEATSDIALYNTATGAVINRLGGRENIAAALAFSPDDRQLAVGERNGAVTLYEAP